MMLLPLILLIVLTIGMAKHGRTGRKRRWTADMQSVSVFQVLALSTLASSTLVKQNMIAPGNNEYRLLSLKGVWSVRNLTAGEGPLIFGVAHSDYSTAEVEEYLENETMLNRGDMVATREISRRLIRRIGQFSGIASEEVVNDGRPTHTRLNWAMSEDSVLDIWVYNFSGGTLTTGGIVSFQGKWTIRWT